MPWFMAEYVSAQPPLDPRTPNIHVFQEMYREPRLYRLGRLNGVQSSEFSFGLSCGSTSIAFFIGYFSVAYTCKNLFFEVLQICFDLQSCVSSLFGFYGLLFAVFIVVSRSSSMQDLISIMVLYFVCHVPFFLIFSFIYIFSFFSSFSFVGFNILLIIFCFLVSSPFVLFRFICFYKNFSSFGF